MIEARSVFFRYHRDWVLRDVSFQIEKGRFIGIIGPNGSGKTSLLKTLYRLLEPQQGEILYGGLPLREIRRRDLARKIAVVPQETHSLFPFRVLEIVLMGRSPYLGPRLFENRQDLEIARKAMEWTDTLPYADRFIDELSGGERKRVFIARALVQEPEVILFDEPTATLDIRHQIDFLRHVSDLNREKNLTIIMASHDLNLASEFCDRLILLKGGEIERMGSPSEVITRETIERVYGCEVWVDPNPVSGLPRVTLLRRKGPPIPHAKI